MELSLDLCFDYAMVDFKPRGDYFPLTGEALVPKFVEDACQGPGYAFLWAVSLRGHLAQVTTGKRTSGAAMAMAAMAAMAASGSGRKRSSGVADRDPIVGPIHPYFFQNV